MIRDEKASASHSSHCLLLITCCIIIIVGSSDIFSKLSLYCICLQGRAHLISSVLILLWEISLVHPQCNTTGLYICRVAVDDVLVLCCCSGLLCLESRRRGTDFTMATLLSSF